ncbi:hypothetical protein H7J87_25935 [Mycolicibacterium wolinskyi]|uniref:Uncharacterized protein n=1 Tax=Mycolicibacterium wolinskyi TaxID=59750 RepID=A0A1X2F0L0_9MYCO|nr:MULTISPECIES: hypothetical protein [Mycolicibacterium]MCV7288774.1 hypothetical protein [Mycolicibacterium wolinskyi]MCV7295996.1 hypothetical protein [Mycolicibacterium goodii]ORX11964.1 hypothetical protein AWC31_35625 [Mycolicibacterium wolinskyi]
MTQAEKGETPGVTEEVTEGAPRKSALWGWAVLALIVLALPVQAAWYTFTSSEPYPALTQPPFKTVPGADGTLSGRTETLAAVLADGSSVPLDADELFSDSWNQGSFVIDAIASQSEIDSRSRAMLRDEIGRHVPAGADVAYLRVVTQEREYRLSENRAYPISDAKTTDIPLGASNGAR